MGPVRDRRAVLLGGAALSLAATAPAGATARPAIGDCGLDLAGMDRDVRPGDDFFRYGGGRWMRDTPIPPDRASWGPFFILRAKAEADVRAIVEDAARQANAPGSISQKVADFYSAYLDVDAIEAAGLAPVKEDLRAIAQARTHEDVARLMGRPDADMGGPVSLSPWPDAKNPDRYALNIVQSGLTLPDRDYYLKDDAALAATRASYRAYVARMLGLAAYPDPAGAAEAVLALETEIARRQWSNARRADRDLTYNPRTQAGLKAFAPDFPWDPLLSALGVPGQDLFVVKELEAVGALAVLFRATPVADWRAYMTFHYLNGAADLLPSAFDDAAFAFNGQVLSGQPRKRERWRRAATALNAALGEAVGQLYVRRHFSPEAKARITILVENLRAAYRARIARLDWMSPATRQAALLKLAGMRVKVGYPDRWRDYAALEVRPGDPVGNRRRARLWDWRRRADRLGQPTDKDEWGMSPQTVNAYYNAYFNEVVFPAAILQPPYFDPLADAAVNYGGVGGVIGHEMGHGFDDQGSKSDENGVQRTWWSPEDLAHFQRLTGALARQYGQYEPLPGLRLNGETTLGENIGDNGGLAVALEAYRLSLKGRPPPVRDGFTGEQRFFLSWAQTYRENIREAELRADIASDPHSPAEFRVNGVVRNMDAWYEAFAVRPGDRLYLAPQDRVRIW